MANPTKRVSTITTVMHHRPGSLHRALDVPQGRRISQARLRWGARHLRDKILRAKCALVLRIHYRKAVRRG